MTEETITIPRTEYDKLKRDELKLLCLEQAGIDNCAAYEYAQELLREAGYYDD